MKKKSILIIIIFSLSISYLISEVKIKFGPFAGLYANSDSNLKQIYNGQELFAGGEAGVVFYRGLGVFLRAGYIRFTSLTQPLEDVTKLSLSPFDISVRYYYQINSISPFLGLGYRFLSYKEEAKLGEKEHVLDEKANSIIIEGGLELYLSKRFSVQLSVNYCKTPVSPKGVEVDLGGLSGLVTFFVKILK